eukprot:UN11219
MGCANIGLAQFLCTIICIVTAQKSQIPSVIYTLDDMNSSLTILLILICAAFTALSVFVWSCYCVARIGCYKHKEVDTIGGGRNIDNIIETMDFSSSEESTESTESDE